MRRQVCLLCVSTMGLCVCVCVLSVLQSMVHAFMHNVFIEAKVMIVNIMLLYYMLIGLSKFHTSHLATL